MCFNASLTALHRVALCLWTLKITVKDVEELLPLQQKHFQCHVAAYEATHIRPKAHYGLHLSQTDSKGAKIHRLFLL